eukprot:scaffold45539_cov51-Attheya_sp.AAC.5
MDNPFIPGLPEDVGRYIANFLDVPTLVRKKVICRSWRALFTITIEQKASTPKPFESGDELRSAVRKYTEYNPEDAEDFATTYGWPIGRWNVSNVEDFETVFAWKTSFNESIGSWDMSSATSIQRMFIFAKQFDQDISSWDTSNVTRMDCMFQSSWSFNQDLSSWETSNVTRMDC